ncbi:MAG: phosphatidate cytidylyltransferase [Rhodoferax sp.]|nr:phosphatidate cytidylyltransferase [Rhodoferax sp.]NCP55011.1 phosphatidate cytidylyltransferase [Rhodoferax sp.]PIW06613.1 MAG: phosphatidate cytidylyltransferase [Comamonadaceae bacterium CG17_big_fil_post_rev_8_21_14_2_50_60_13]PIY27269.1 MAG: phosphatidate cytidylyltransferase [Comamonadaceae bacterium CG_4_10_14_3_um_filter_60_75]PJC16244.1 MAG: phosphatidate cytidylyltransferase [Comamonadaceae bacterium CG_4_9_14_0_8_um_filter_60_18]
MYQTLKNLTPAQQIGAMFVIVFGLLLLAGLALFLRSMREFADPQRAQQHRDEIDNLTQLLKTSWLLVFVFWVAWLAGDVSRLVLFGLGSFFALREFLTLSPTRRGDHRSLVLAFFVVLPFQYWLVGTAHFNLFTVFIPVYVFLAIPVVSALANDPTHFLERNAKLQWGIMVCIYGMSHVPALLLLKFPRYDQRNAFLLLFLVLVVQTCMVTQHLVARRLMQLNKPAAAPLVSQSFIWRAWWSGMVAGSLLGALLAGITPFVPGQAFALSFIACGAGSLGHLVMKALKRDRGIPIWRGEGRGVTGAGGMLDRIDALCFAAPVFFHSARWYFGL